MSSFYGTLNKYLACACSAHIYTTFISTFLYAMSIIVEISWIRLLEKVGGQFITVTGRISTSILYINIYLALLVRLLT